MGCVRIQRFPATGMCASGTRTEASEREPAARGVSLPWLVPDLAVAVLRMGLNQAGSAVCVRNMHVRGF